MTLHKVNCVMDRNGYKNDTEITSIPSVDGFNSNMWKREWI